MVNLPGRFGTTGEFEVNIALTQLSIFPKINFSGLLRSIRVELLISYNTNNKKLQQHSTGIQYSIIPFQGKE